MTEMQCGFRKIMSTAYDQMNVNEYTGLLLLDLKKAFDTVFLFTLRNLRCGKQTAKSFLV